MRYKILFLSSWFPNKLEPTNGNFVQRHAESVSLLHDVEILHAIGNHTQPKKFVFDDQQINGIRTLIVYYKNSNNPLQNFLRRMIAYKKGFSIMNPPDLVHANVMQKSMLFAVYLKLKLKIPFVVTEHWSGFLQMNRFKLSKSDLFISKIISKNSSAVLPVSNFLKRDLNDNTLNTKTEVVENVVDTKLFKVKDSEPEVFTFLHISNLIQLKNPEKIINVAVLLSKEFNNFELHIGGDGDVEKLNEFIRKAKAESFIKTFGTLELYEVAVKMRSSSCFILFSDYENFPCVLLESLSSGTPAIATKVGGIPEIINASNGILISNSDLELYNAMKDMLLQNSTFKSPADLHQSVEDRFSKQVIAEKFDKIYQETMQEFQAS
ncbi:glycosyltransferase family 4 protein [Chryseobacterium sp. MP_3.2]|uniref:glycosyltransferase family 4 protein n=1 Tax=Chryseobacterium sp. MP_3.2 TaxID=3071712 RepID=UPI002DFE73E7|nr:glycosyltransferase involved in cell wall biosynthesis [Chryseobacterium sp. MP_3.2]